MEIINKYLQNIARMNSQISAQLDALVMLQRAFDELQQHLRRLDQLARLDDICEIVKREVQDIRRTETAAHCANTEGSLVGGLAGFGLVTLLAARQNMENPAIVGAMAAKKCLNDNLPFGRVMISIGQGGVFQQVEVIPISKRARELHCSESDIIT